MIMKAVDGKRQADDKGEKRKLGEEGEERQREGWVRERILCTLASDFYSPVRDLWELPV